MQKFDVAFIGTGITALYAAALLSKSGRTVILLDPAERAGGAAAAVERDGFRFPAGSSIGYGLAPGGPAHALCAAYGLTAADLSNVSRYQVALPDRRITISPDSEETLTELRREFPREIDKLTRLYRDAGKMYQKASPGGLSSYLLKKRITGPYLRKHNLSRELAAYFDLQLRFFFGQDIRTAPLSSLVLLLTVPPRSFPSGLGIVTARLLAAIDGNHGTIRLREPLPEMVFHRRKISGLRTSQGTIEPRSVVVNTVWQSSEHTTFIALREGSVPVGMESTVISLPDYARPDEMITLTLSHNDGLDETRGMRLLTATFFGAALSGAPLGARAGKVQDIMPFLSDFAVMTSDQGQGNEQYALPKEVAVPSFDPQNAVKRPVPTSMKNLYLVPDSSRSLHLALSAGDAVSKRLR